LQSLEETQEWIIELYGERLRKDNKTFVWTHSVRVKERLDAARARLVQLGLDPNCISEATLHAALLHDCLEDVPKILGRNGKMVRFDEQRQQLLANQIRERCGEEVERIVWAVTHKWDQPRQARYRALQRRAQRVWDIPECLIKIADHLDNFDEPWADWFRKRHVFDMLYRFLPRQMEKKGVYDLYQILLELEGITFNEGDSTGDLPTI